MVPCAQEHGSRGLLSHEAQVDCRFTMVRESRIERGGGVGGERIVRPEWHRACPMGMAGVMS